MRKQKLSFWPHLMLSSPVYDHTDFIAYIHSGYSCHKIIGIIRIPCTAIVLLYYMYDISGGRKLIEYHGQIKKKKIAVT